MVFSISIVVFLFATCAPIPIKYITVSNHLNPIDEYSNLNNEHKILKCRIDQNHFPNQRLENRVQVTIENNYNDTISFDKDDFLQLVTTVNVIDSIQLKKLWIQNFKKFLRPKEKLNLENIYWSETFHGSFRNLVFRLRQNEVKISLKYKIKTALYVDSVFLKPDL